MRLLLNISGFDHLRNALLLKVNARFYDGFTLCLKLQSLQYLVQVHSFFPEIIKAMLPYWPCVLGGTPYTDGMGHHAPSRGAMDQ